MYCSEEKTVSLKLEIGFPAIVARQADRELFEAAEPAHLRLEGGLRWPVVAQLGQIAKYHQKLKSKKFVKLSDHTYASNSLTQF